MLYLGWVVLQRIFLEISTGTNMKCPNNKKLCGIVYGELYFLCFIIDTSSLQYLFHCDSDHHKPYHGYQGKAATAVQGEDHGGLAIQKAVMVRLWLAKEAGHEVVAVWIRLRWPAEKEALARGLWSCFMVVVNGINNGGGREQCGLGSGKGMGVWWCSWYGKSWGLWGRNERERGRERVNTEVVEKTLGGRGRW